MIGPQFPGNISRRRSSTPPAGPQIPSNPPKPDSEPEEDEDDYVPELPPDLIAERASQKRVLGPTLPRSATARSDDEEDDYYDDDVGPMPLPPAYTSSLHDEQDGVREFLEREKRRKQAVEEASKPKALKREEWMLVPPSASDLLGSIDTTRLNKGRKFAPTTSSHSRNPDTSLWTETPAERQQRLADELSGKKRRKENSDAVGDDDGRTELEARKKRRRDEEIQQAVSEHTKQHRSETLLEMHSKTASAVEEQEKEKKKAEGIWDHSRDMALSGRLMDDQSRNRLIRDAKGLGDRFGSSKFA